MNVIPETCHK